MNRVAVLNVVGLTEPLLGGLPRLNAFRRQNAWVRVRPAFPAVTCVAQSNYLTGALPERHGIVANGWYERSLAEVQFWRQSNHLVAGPKLWDVLRARLPGFTCAQLFWWFNMYADVEFSVTPRPLYPADGRKIFDIYAWPYSLRTDLKRALGEFPFPSFWGPAAGVGTGQAGADAATRWIAAAARWVEEKHQPTLSLVYLPHLDYNLQRHGPYSPLTPEPPGAGTAHPAPAVLRELNPCIRSDLARLDAVVGDLIDFFHRRSVRVAVLSEYGLANVRQPVHLNRLLRTHGWLTVKEELGLELLDPGASRAFAVADHQVAHVYVRDPFLLGAVRAALEQERGVGAVLGPAELAAHGLAHPRTGDWVAVAAPDAWFTYYYWLDDSRAPDFARTVDIHRKPGFDPVELFLDPALGSVRLRIAWRLLQKRLGFRMLMDIIPVDASLVRGSHGHIPADPADWPVLIAENPRLSASATIDSTAVQGRLLELF